MLVHICCAVDSHYFLQKLRNDFPEKRLTGFFYNPNIHPQEEYRLRLLETERSCAMLGIKLIAGDYNPASWFDKTKGLEHEPEKGQRCSVCFEHRFEVAAQQAVKMGCEQFTSTLLVSPKKSLVQLAKAGESLGVKHGVKFFAPDYRKASGTQEQNKMAKEAGLYRQNYCGCLHALRQQRDAQERFSDELSSAVSGQIQPGSIAQRLALYQRRIELEESQRNYRIVKDRFLNWRLLSALLKVDKKPVAAHFLPYSTLKRGYTRGRISDAIGPVHCLGRDEVKFLSLAEYNRIGNLQYDTVRQLMFNPPGFECEMTIRHTLFSSPYDLSALIVVDAIPDKKVEIFLQAELYHDVKERLHEER